MSVFTGQGETAAKMKLKGQNEAERTNSAIGDSVVDGSAIEWEKNLKIFPTWELTKSEKQKIIRKYKFTTQKVIN